ncbi:MAG: tyrosine-type recombinase/integrase [bacterium]|nr:tyrosine-type recombinase/integrase [bacterium]
MTALTPVRPNLEELVAVATAAVDSEHSRRAYSRALRDFLSWCQARELPFERATVQRYRMELAQQKAPASVNQALSAIKSLAREAMDRFVLPDATGAAIVQVRSVPQRGRRAGNWLTLDQAKRLIDAPPANSLSGLRDRALLGVLLGSGVRRQECASIQVEQVVRRSGRWVVLDLARKRDRVATVPLPAWVRPRLKAWWAAADITAGPAFRAVGQGDRLLGPLSDSGVWWVVQAWGQRLGLEVRPHDLRRTGAALALDGGASLRQIQVMLGHASIQTTERYLRTITELHDPACDKIELGGKEKEGE